MLASQAEGTDRARGVFSIMVWSQGHCAFGVRDCLPFFHSVAGTGSGRCEDEPRGMDSFEQKLSENEIADLKQNVDWVTRTVAIRGDLSVTPEAATGSQGQGSKAWMLFVGIWGSRV